MNEIIATKHLLFGSQIEIKKGDTFYWKNGIYSENWQSWTIIIYKKNNDKYVNIGSVVQRDFTREIQYMQDEERLKHKTS
jgi:hypothetical protein